MRVTFNAGEASSLADLQRLSAELLHWQQVLSSGRRVNAPSDDPAAAARIAGENENLASIDQYVRSADSANARLTVVDTVLSDIITNLTSARTAAASAVSTVATPVQREAAAKQLEGIRDALFSDLNTVFGGTYLFAGAASTAAAYTRDAGGTISAYQGDHQEVRLAVDQSESVRITLDGEAIVKGADAQDLFTSLDALIGAVRAGNQAAIQSGMDALQRAFDRAQVAQGGVGTDLARLTDQGLRLTTMKQAATTRLSADQDANMAEAISRESLADAAYRAALGALANRSNLSLLDYLR